MTASATPAPPFTPEQEARIAVAIDEALKVRAAAIEVQVRRQLAGCLLGRDPDLFDLPNTRTVGKLYWSGHSPTEIHDALKRVEGGGDV